MRSRIKMNTNANTCLTTKTRTIKFGYEVRERTFPGSLITHDDKPAIYILVTFDKNEMLGILQGWSTLTRCARKNNWRTDWR
jgi:hypothetical protein